MSRNGLSMGIPPMDPAVAFAQVSKNLSMRSLIG